MSPAQIERWWAANPDANVGLATGYGLLVVDVDGPIGKASLRALEQEHGKLPATVEARTARGRHLFFACPSKAACVSTIGKLAPGIDTRGDGGYVLVAPSVHPSGARYRWVREPGKHHVAQAPAWLVDVLAAAKATHGKGPAISPPPNRRDPTRSGEDARLALSLTRRGVAPELIAAELRKRPKYREMPTAQGERYISRLLDWADAVRDEDTHRERVTRAFVEHLPARDGMRPLSRVILSTISEQGRSWVGLVADEDHSAVWLAVLPDVDVHEVLALPNGARLDHLRGRVLDVSRRDGAVRFVRIVN